MTFTYTNNGLRASMAIRSGTHYYSYDPAGNLSGYTYPNGVATSYTYDTLNRLTQMGSAKGGALSGYTYTLGAAGNRTSVAELSGRTVSYGYDALYRLTSEAITSDPASKNGTVGYSYDAVGNRQQMTSTLTAIPAGSFSYNANDQLSTDSYDSNGNTTSAAGITSSYDFEDHMAQKGAVTVVYDGDGNRVAETVGGVTTKYLVDTQNPTGYAQVVDELQSGTVTRTYAYGLERISELQTISSTWTPSFYGYDGHGSVRQLTNAAGTVTDSYDYDAFGNLINATGSTPNNYLFAGEQYDPALGLYYNRARYYNNTTGRFWSMDTEEGQDEQPVTLHKYLYADADPIDGTDPSGNQDSMAELGAEMSMMDAINSMAFIQIGGILPDARIGLGIEVPSSSAVKNNVLNVAIDPGHAFVYFKEKGTVTSILSFGPDQWILDNKNLFMNGGLAGNVHWPLKGSVSTWESTITAPQLSAGKQAITDFKARKPNYSPYFQCTDAALSIANKTGITLPDGVGPIIAEKFGKNYFTGNLPNPYHLSQQMTKMYGPPQVVSASSFPAP